MKHFLWPKTQKEMYDLLFIDRPSGTSLSMSPSNTTVLNGTELTFNCTTDAYPDVDEYKFYHDGYELGSSSSGIYSTNMTKDGKYFCVPINAAGIGKNASIAINVVGECLQSDDKSQDL